MALGLFFGGFHVSFQAGEREAHSPTFDPHLEGGGGPSSSYPIPVAFTGRCRHWSLPVNCLVSWFSLGVVCWFFNRLVLCVTLGELQQHEQTEPLNHLEVMLMPPPTGCVKSRIPLQRFSFS